MGCLLMLGGALTIIGIGSIWVSLIWWWYNS